MQDIEAPKLNWFYRFFCWCSGVRLYLLKLCPTDFNKYFGIGIIVTFTGIMASISGGYALYTIFNNLTISCIFGIIWGLLIFSLDWYILASLKKEKKIAKEFLNTLPRILLAILLGIIISKPLELKLFEKEINQELISMQKDLEINYKNKVSDEFDEIEVLQTENGRLYNEIKSREAYRDSLFTLIIEEAEGRSPTSMIGKGPVYREKKQEFDKVNNELIELKNRNIARISKNESRLNAIREEQNIEIKMGTETSKNYDGFLAKTQALNSLSKKNKDVKYVNFFVILLFIIIESSPMLVKLMAPRGAYDILLDFEEKKNTIEIKRLTSKIELENLISNESGPEAEIQKIKAKNSLQKYQLTRLIKAKKKVIDSKIKKWENLQIDTNNKMTGSISDEQLFSF